MRRALIAVGLVACASKAPPSKYPPQKAGCPIQVFTEDHVPTYQTDSIGTVSATCDDFMSNEDCLRELKDQACKLGADTLWGVSDDPSKYSGKKHFTGRAAHQK